MLNEVFYWLFNMSIVATITGFVIMLLRLIKPLPRRMVFVLWAIPFIRFVIPIGIGSKYSLMALLDRLAVKTVVVYKSRMVPSMGLSMTNSIQYAETYFPVTYKTNVLENIFNIASIIWLVVSVVLILLLIICYFKSMSYIKTASNFKDNIYISTKVSSPAVYGIIKPIIVMSEFNKNDIAYILSHEQVHIKRGDNLWRTVAVLISILHWFNPFVWLFLKYFLQDMELSCDEIAIRSMSLKQRKAYAHTLLNTHEKLMTLSSPFGGAGLQLRVKNILTYKHLSVFSLVCFVLLSLIIFFTLLTNAI